MYPGFTPTTTCDCFKSSRLVVLSPRSVVERRGPYPFSSIGQGYPFAMWRPFQSIGFRDELLTASTYPERILITNVVTYVEETRVSPSIKKIGDRTRDC